MRVVLDTNTMLAALLSPGKTADRLLQVVLLKHRLLVSAAMAAEYGCVLARPKFGRLGEEKSRLALLQDVLAAPRCMPVRARIRVQRLPADASDAPFVEAALSGVADYLVSGDAHLLALKQLRSPLLPKPVSVERPAEALRLLSPRRAADTA